MSSTKKYTSYDKYLLRGKLGRKGFERWRYFFSASEKLTGQKRSFFIEIYYINPFLSPKKIVIAHKSRPRISETNLQYALTAAAKDVGEELFVQPSYVLVKAGIYGSDGIQVNQFFTANAINFVKKEAAFHIGNNIFGADSLTGSVEVTNQDKILRPEIFCDCGKIEWNLKFDKAGPTSPIWKQNGFCWHPSGIQSVFAGAVKVNGHEFEVSPKKSFGYIEKSWGSDVNRPYYHISANYFTSLISAKPLAKSSFAFEGEYDSALKAMVEIDGKTFTFAKKSIFSRFTELHSFTETPADADGEKLHWAVSLTKGKYVIDIDLYAKTAEMFVRNYELPEGGHQFLQILSSGNGFGEIKFFKKIGKNLELLEHATIKNAICEYGKVDSVEGDDSEDF